tara:strand:+ start:214 stop:912 length:699 start_codon:yes stop_codon:yes gene_type:complete
MIDNKFLKVARDLFSPTMGTENIGPFIYDIIKITRARKILEIGGGYTSIFILKALADNEILFSDDSLIEKTLKNDAYYNSKENISRLYIVDDLSHPQTTANLISKKAKQLNLDSYLTLHDADFMTFSKDFPDSELPIDLLWLDCGDLNAYQIFLKEYFPLVNKSGGIVLIHSLLTNLHGQFFLKQLKLSQATNQFNDFEMISLLEPHKTRQNSLTMLRFISNESTQIYSVMP